MSLVSIINDDDDNYSSSSSTNSDDDIDGSNCDTHRTCSRYTACNRKNHQHSLIGSISGISLSKNSKPIKGDIRSVDNEPGHQQKYDGLKWRRICSYPDCLKYLNGGIFHINWLCRKHLLSLSIEPSTTSDEVIAKNTETIVSTSKSSQKLCTRRSNKQIKHYKRGEIMINTDGIRQKYNGKIWRPVCTYDNCNSFIVAHGYCHRHDRENRKKRSEILSLLDDIPQENSISKSPITRSIPSIVKKPKKGDIQLVRQLWSGNKWYSLCNYHTQDCTRRSAGLKYANLCDIHYKEYLQKQKDQNTPISLSPRVKRKKSINRDSIHSSNNIETQTTTLTSSQCQSTIHHEQYIQTDLTYPIESNDLREGCILVDNDSDDRYRCESPQLMIYIKKEEENYVNNKRKLSIDVNSLSMNCKLEITKLEF